MALVKIFALTGQEIEYKKDSLTLKKENNSLSSDFKVPHSSFPFLIIENDIAKSVLGSADITSIKKNKIVPVIILENGIRYYGELQQLTVLPNFRKCNLKYGSDLLTIINKKISEFMPVVSVIPGETTPVPFSETSTEIIEGAEHWETYPVGLIGSIYPDVKFNFPTLYWLNKYGEALEPTDPWYPYLNHINKFGENEVPETIFITNFGEVDGATVTVENKNVPMPFVFLLSPLHYIFESIGWKNSGNFTTHELIKSLMFVPKKDNLTQVILRPEPVSVTLPAEPTWILRPGVGSIPDKFQFFFFTEGLTPGRVKIIFEFELLSLPLATPENFFYRTVLAVAPGSSLGAVFIQKIEHNAENNYIVSGEIEIDIQSSLLWSYEDNFGNLPVSYSLVISYIANEKEFQQMHPTIDLGRYVPEWTVGDFLNYLKNQFNLDITLNDFKKEITLNLNETSTLNEAPAIISQSLAMKSYDIAANSSFVLKYQNATDAALFITQEEVVPFDGTTDDFTQTIQSNFKLIPSNAYTSVLSEEINDKEGVGLVIYNEINAPFTDTQTENGYNLNIPGTKGIYETFFKRWIKFLLNASNCEIRGFFTEQEILSINKLKSVYINNQRFIIIDIETTEASNNFQEVKMQLLSVNY